MNKKLKHNIVGLGLSCGAMIISGLLVWSYISDIVRK